jgi:hypothetical protein
METELNECRFTGGERDVPDLDRNDIGSATGIRRARHGESQEAGLLRKVG